jgi:hypothetical protein
MAMVRVPVLFSLLLGSPAVLLGATIVVDPSGGGDYTEIQPALDAAADGDTVLVRPGDYVLDEEVLQINKFSNSPKAITLRSEDGPAVTSICAVMFHQGETSTSVLEGFTLASGVSLDDRYGVAGNFALICDGASSPLVKGCRIEGNEALSNGVFCASGSSPSIEDCVVTRLRDVGVYLHEASPRLIRCRIEGNDGMGLYGWGETVQPVIEDCAFRRNHGSAMSFSGRAAPTIRRCVFAENSTGLDLTASCGGLVEDCTFTGDGIVCDGGASPTVRSSTIAFGGAALSTDDGAAPVFERCTIAWNSWGCSLHSGDHPTFRDCIIWGNLNGSFLLDGSATATVDHSCVEGGSPFGGEGNIAADPLFCGWGRLAEVFVDASSPGPGDGSAGSPFPALAPALEYGLSLAEGSPCIGAGSGGADMGDDGDAGDGRGTCGEPGVAGRTVQVAAGEYSFAGLTLIANVSLIGAGAEETTILGDVCGLRTGATLAHLTVTGGHEGVNVQGRQSPRIEDVTARGNRGTGFFIVESSPILARCTAAGNAYGGIGCSNSSPLIENCAVFGNSANRYSGGISSWGPESFPTIVNCTITGNVAGSGGTSGVVCLQDGMATVKNTIIWGNTPQANCGADATCLADRDPLFVSGGVYDFARYGTMEIDGFQVEVPDFIVEEPDLRLLPGSPAIDAGDCAAAPDRDIAGIPRPQGAGCDIGAHEYSGEVAFIRGDPNGDGGIDVSDAVFVLVHLFGGGAAPACPKAADMNDDGEVDISDPITGLEYLFLGMSPIPAPSPTCGFDGTEDGLDCPAHPACP